MASIVKHSSGWRAFVLIDGKRRSKVFDTKREAQVWARGIEEAGDRAREAGTTYSARNPVTTFGDLLDVYDENARIAVGRSRAGAFKNLRAGLGDLRISELDLDAFIDYARSRAEDGVGAATTGQELTYAATVLRHAGVLAGVQEAAAVACNNLAVARGTLKHIDLVSPPDERERRPTEAELRAIRDYFARSTRSKTPIWQIAKFAIATAMRLGEIVKLRWEDIDTENRIAVVRDRKHPRKKQGNDSRIPLLRGPTVILGEVVDPLQVMLEVSPHKRGRVFPYSSGNISTKWRWTMTKLKIVDLHFHDLRHDGVSRLFEFGYQIPQVSKVSGHKSWKNLKKYTNIRPESLHEKTVTIKNDSTERGEISG